MFVLIASRNERINIFGIGKTKLSIVTFVLYMKILDNLFGFVPNKDIEINKVIQSVVTLVNSLGFASDLNMLDDFK